MIARVFPRRTNGTPWGEHVYVGLPPLWAGDYEKAEISVAFTWDIPWAKRFGEEWSKFCPVEIGGPAFDDPGGDFVPGRYLALGNVITSRGCPKNCPWCLVPKREGKLRELPITKGWRVQDNSLLACSREHIEAVFDMLSSQKRAASFPGGLDIDYLTRWHVDLLKSIRCSDIFVSCGRPEDLDRLDKAADLLNDFSIEHRRCYVLISYNGDTLLDAERRLEAVYKKGFLPFAMRYRPPSDGWDESFIYQDRDWNILTRKWTRPAWYRTAMKVDR
jgi:hypothetical protein